MPQFYDMIIVRFQECFYWEAVELVKKLALSEVAALAVQGSLGRGTVSQVAAFTGIAFIFTAFNLYMQPCERAATMKILPAHTP